ncbi:hypothetical protein TNCV_4532121, partial [Trichonephila clavipes]
SAYWLFLEYSEVYKKQSSSPVGHVLSPVLYRAPSVRINLIVCLIELCTSFELRDTDGPRNFEPWSSDVDDT